MGVLNATVGIFLPSFLFEALLNPLVQKMRNSKLASVFLDAANVASIAIIAAICYRMGKETITDWRTIITAIPNLAIVLSLKNMNSPLVVIIGAVLGYLLSIL
jgi:chromate transporter